MLDINRADIGHVQQSAAESFHVYEDKTRNHVFFFSSRRRHTRCYRDWSSDVCSSDLTRLNSSDGIRDATVTGVQTCENGKTSCREKRKRCTGSSSEQSNKQVDRA